MTPVEAPFSFRLPEDLSATAPPEARGVPRDRVRLLVAGGGAISHVTFRDVVNFLEPSDALVVNNSATLAAAVDGMRSDGPVVVHFSAPLEEDTWAVEL